MNSELQIQTALTSPMFPSIAWNVIFKASSSLERIRGELMSLLITTSVSVSIY